MVSSREGLHSVNNNEAPNTKKVDTESLETKVYNGFVQEKLEKSGVSFINATMALPETDMTHRDDVMHYIHAHSEFDALGEDFRDKISLGKIKSRLTLEYAKVKSKRQSLKNQILKNYDISSQKYDQDIGSKIENLEIAELSDALESSERTKRFLLRHSIVVPEKKSLKKILQAKNLEKRLQKLPPAKAAELRDLIGTNFSELNINSSNFSNNMNFLMKSIMEESLFTQTEKIDIIHSLIPSISLQKALEYGLIEDSKIDAYITKNFLEGVDASHKTQALTSLRGKLKELDISTDQLDFSNKKNLDRFTSTEDFSRLGREIQEYHSLHNPDAIENFEDLQNNIQNSLGEKIMGLNHFKKGSIIEIVTQRQGQTSSEYYEILSTSPDSAPKNRIILKNQGGGGMYMPKNESTESFSYGDFYNLLKNPQTIKSAAFYDRDTFDLKIAKGEIKQSEAEYNFVTDQDKEARLNIKRNELAAKLKKDGLTDKILQGDDLDTFLAGLAPEQKQNYEQDISSLHTSQDTNLVMLLTQLDGADAEGKKYGLERGTTFHVPKSDDYYTILEVDASAVPEGSIKLQGIDIAAEDMTFEDFFQVFSQTQAKRVSKVQGGEGLLGDVNDAETKWTGIDFKDGNIVNSSYEDPKDQICEYLVAPDEKSYFWKKYNTLKIHDISGSDVTVSFGNTQNKDITKKVKGKDKKIGSDTIYTVSKIKQHISLGMLAAWTKKANLSPKSLSGENAEEQLPKGEERKGGAYAWYYRNFSSVSSVIAGAKMWKDNLGNYFKDAENERAMELLGTYGMFMLTPEQKSSMKMRKEQAEKKSTDEALELLKVLDSAPATKMIEKWILNKYTSESKKVAAMLFMFEKYGVLYEKAALIQHKGKFIWYEALGGTIGDELYLKEKQKAKDEGLHFTEENLIYALMSNQCKGFLKPERRGKLYKEVEAIMGKGLTDEMEKGKGDADKKGTYHSKEDFAFGELKDGGFPNAMGAFESMLNKGAEKGLPQLNALPFVMLTSGAANSFPAQLTNKFKAGSLVMSSFFTHSQSHTDLYNSVVVQLSQDIQDTLGKKNLKYANMGTQAKQLIYGMEGKKEGERVLASMEFYAEYEDILGRALLGLNTRKEDAEAEFETWIEDKSDSVGIYNSYRGVFKSGFGAIIGGGYLDKSEELLKDAYASGDPGTGGLTGMDVETFAAKYLISGSSSYGFRNPDLGNMFWKEITGQIDALKNNTHLSEAYKEQRIGKILTGLMNGIMASYGQRNNEIDMILSNPASTFYSRFHEWGVTQEDFGLGGQKFDENAKGQTAIQKYTKNILGGGKANSYNFSLKDLTSDVQAKAASNLNRYPGGE